MAEQIAQGDRRALARAITLVESGRGDHRAQATALLDTLLGQGRQAVRVGLSGTPGVGKSTFIEAFGLMLIAQHGLRVAVLAVDPSSQRTGGSILGDKTRMEQLSRAPQAFIRPSPSQSHLGGVARRTREAVALCEAAGFDIVLIETVGVGQSETVVAEPSDVFTLLLAPGGGDELQGVKRGIMEAADLIVINKADGDLRATATRTCADYAGALRLLRKRPADPDGFPAALTVSAQDGDGLDRVWDAITTLVDWRRAGGHWDARRAAQARHWFDEELRAAALARLATPEARALTAHMAAQVQDGRIAPARAAQQVLARIWPELAGAPESLDAPDPSA